MRRELEQIAEKIDRVGKSIEKVAWENEARRRPVTTSGVSPVTATAINRDTKDPNFPQAIASTAGFPLPHNRNNVATASIQRWYREPRVWRSYEF